MSHIISPSTSLCIHFAGLGQVSHNRWFVFWQVLISFNGFGWLLASLPRVIKASKVSHVKVWILRTLTTMSGSVLSSGLDLSCLLVWICLVSWSAETSKFSVIWRSAGQGNKQHIHSSAGRKPENNNSSLKSRKQSFDIDVNHPPVCQSLRVLQQFYLSYLFILKSWDNLF